MRSLNVFTALLLLFLFALASPVMGETELPPVMAKEMGLFPGAAVTQVMTLPDAEVAFLECASASPDDVAAYYKEQMLAAGYVLQAEENYGPGVLVVVEKEGMTAMVDASRENGPTIVNMTMNMPMGAPESTPAQGQEQPQDAAQQPLNTTGDGASVTDFVSLRPGDRILETMDIMGSLAAKVASDAQTLVEIMDYYQETLMPEGWMKLARIEEGDDAGLLMVREGSQLMLMQEDADPAAGNTIYSLAVIRP